MKVRSRARVAALPLVIAALGGCYADHGGCPGAVEDAPVCDDPTLLSLQASEEGGAVQWLPGSIRVTYDPRLEARRDDIADTLAAWEASCLPLCFGELRAQTIEEGAQPPDGSIHFAPDAAPSDGSVQATLYYRRSDGSILAAHVGLGADLEPGAIAHGIGHALGLQHAPPGTDSVMAGERSGPLLPTCVDHRSLCAAY